MLAASRSRLAVLRYPPRSSIDDLIPSCILIIWHGSGPDSPASAFLSAKGNTIVLFMQETESERYPFARCAVNKKEIAKHFYEVIVSKNLLEELPQYVAEHCLLISGEDKIPLGVAGMQEHLAAVKQTYPDYTTRIIRQYQDGDYVISEFIMEGTHAGEWLGMKPTHKKLSFTGIDIDKVEEGKITEHGGAVNTFETLYGQHMIQPVRPEGLGAVSEGRE